jgi:hypothetical protein
MRTDDRLPAEKHKADCAIARRFRAAAAVASSSGKQAPKRAPPTAMAASAMNVARMLLEGKNACRVVQ